VAVNGKSGEVQIDVEGDAMLTASTDHSGMRTGNPEA
jgi:hypothetical protein